MATAKTRALLHPVRMRVVFALGGDALTTAQLASSLSDVPQATLYRHVAVLVDEGLIEVVGERQARGAVEKTYRVVDGAVHLNEADAAAMTIDDHREGFMAFMGAVMAQFGAYLDSPGARPGEDAFGYRQAQLWMDDDEVEAFAAEVATVAARYSGNAKGEGRRAYRLSTVLAPEPLAAPDDPA